MAEAKTHTLTLAGDLSLRQAMAVREELHDAATVYDTIAVDGRGIAEIDLSIVQLLVCAFKTAEAAGKRLSVGFPAGGALDTVLQRAGFIDGRGESLAPPCGPWLRIPGSTESELHD